MVASILLHVAGALKHQFVDKDATLKRMWFGKSEASTAQPHKGTRTAPLAAVAVYIVVTAIGAAAGLGWRSLAEWRRLPATVESSRPPHHR